MTNPRFSALAHARAATTAQLKQEVADYEAANPKRVVITFPWPPQKLSPNGRAHWRTKANATKAYRALCGRLCQEAGLHLKKHALVRYGLNLRVSYVFNPPDARKRDKDNCIASFKAGQDGIADVLCVDDNHFVTTYAMGLPGAGNVVVTIEAAE